MSESQNIEYKSSWHDDYLKWICGFTNAQGGKIYAEEARRLPDIDGLSTPELLDKLHLTKNAKLKRAAIVLFGKDPGWFYPNTLNISCKGMKNQGLFQKIYVINC
jgi:predicted HTH transcriptional regulator